MVIGTLANERRPSPPGGLFDAMSTLRVMIAVSVDIARGRIIRDQGETQSLSTRFRLADVRQVGGRLI